ncbi:MAG: transglutaminase domain-containing protein [Lachnospiraceae bacterium]|nr:transglutaminase domain-containing protein [Lachnospiraceae bacterium]
MKKRLVFILILLFALGGCGQQTTQPSTPSDNPQSTSANTPAQSAEPTGPLRDATPEVLVPDSSGTTVFEAELYRIDVSNSDQGYVMVQYKGDNEKVKLQIALPNETVYTYLVTKYNEYVTYPLPGGTGNYTITLYEAADIENDLYAVIFTETIDVTLTDAFLPFLYPNNYVNFTADSEAVAKAEVLAADCYSDLDVIASVYNFVIENISYDYEKVENGVQFGYTPDINETLETKKGICFDYASLMSAMLRSQRIPTKLEVGYAGETYHAWISCFVDEIGWVDKLIQFDGQNWTLIDPTFAASSTQDGRDLSSVIGDGTNYQVKYNY